MPREKIQIEKQLLSTLFCVLVFLTVNDANGLERPNGDCGPAIPIAAGNVVRSIEARCYTIDVAEPGILALEIAAPGRVGSEAWLREPGPLCGFSGTKHATFDTFERWAGRRLIDVLGRGTYRFCVGAAVLAESSPEYKLSTLFVAARTTKEGDPREEEPDPDPLVPDPETTSGPILYEPFTEACGALTADDHGDTIFCATPVKLGVEVEGEIWNVWGDDEDVFVFRLAELATVRLEMASDGTVLGSLYDHHGHRLHVRTRERGADRGFGTTLAPGFYAVRLSADSGLGGAYRLRLALVDR